ncbi:hypothetical protein LXT21_43180 [Myxococcus sp. K38C18041901]|uniref:hypothetical protein n=1 Tax=Myxococcus guangdongensis TaxID=2906760 RepID=UPI0020A8258B|nr:hypothetical protein [Myxococcus guangdongensis]MCP3065591.1 hypothetical protein [Myxococcus guangdongensis]
MGVRWMLGWTLPLVALGYAEASSQAVVTPSTQGAPAPEASRRVELSYQDPSCNPVEARQCLCVGSVGSAESTLRELGLDAQVLRTSGVPCIRGDFDKDGAPDYAFPGKGFSCNGSVPVRILFTRKGLVREVQSLPREVSCLQLYLPNKKPGLHGVPATSRDALVDWGEGNATWFYRFDGKRWTATSHLSESH